MGKVTIDNLGPEASREYAQGKELYEPRFINEASVIGPKSAVDVTAPATRSEVDKLLDLKLQKGWAEINPPEGYDQGRTVFSYELIPSMGPPDRLAATREKLASFEPRSPEAAPETISWEADREMEDQMREKERLLAGCDTLIALDGVSGVIRNKLSEFHKG